jgi:hypothetical protein
MSESPSNYNSAKNPAPQNPQNPNPHNSNPQNLNPNPPRNAALKAQVRQLEAKSEDETLDAVTRAKIQVLTDQLKQQLRNQSLSVNVQRELAALLSLFTNLNEQNPNLVEIVDLAIAVLMEVEEMPNAAANPRRKPFSRRTKDLNRNLVFVREMRQQIERQLQKHPNPLRAIITGAGSPYNRLISGLSWFFTIFVAIPMLSLGVTFVLLNLSANQRDLKQTIKQQRTQLQEQDEALAASQQRLLASGEVRNQFETRLNEINRQLEDIQQQIDPPPVPSPPANAAAANQPLPVPNNGAPVTNPENLPAPPPTPATAAELATVQALTDQLNQLEEQLETIQGNIQNTLSEAAAVPPAPTNATPPPSTTEAQDRVFDSRPSLTSKEQFQAVLANYLDSNAATIWIISMGALGSAVSVIVRSKKFIDGAKDSNTDLFFVGFFRPVVGMSFAIFAIAVIKSGVFANIVSLGTAEDANQTQLFVAIAFIAGFSERLVQDVVGRTEDTFGVSSSRSDKG